MSKLVIVDDDRTMVSLLTTLLEMEGHLVVRASGTQDLQSILNSDRPDLIIMDVFLTDGDGVEFLNSLRASESHADIPVVMSSGMDLEERCTANGANGFLLKPYTPEQLIETINNVLGSDGGG